MPDVPSSVTHLSAALLAGVRQALSDKLVGFYLSGSLALGGFDPATSDVDILVVTEQPLSDAEFAAVGALHRRVSPDDNQYGFPYDVIYIDRATARRFAPGQRHVKVGHGESLHRGPHRPNGVLERWTVREHGITVAGPDPKTLIDPISSDEIRRAIRDELRERLRCWIDGTWPEDELSARGAQAFEVETACRALHTLVTGVLSTKREAMEWAVDTLPERWQGLIEWSRLHHADPAKDRTRSGETLDFLRWSVDQNS